MRGTVFYDTSRLVACEEQKHFKIHQDKIRRASSNMRKRQLLYCIIVCLLLYVVQ
jgi:hypothetical protein